MSCEHVHIVLLRRPKSAKEDPRESRSDPFWEFGSFGCTGCHGGNILHPRNADEIAGGRLAFAQGGDNGFRLVYLTPAVTVHPGGRPRRTDAFHPQRRQYSSTEILKILAPYVSRETWRVLGVTELDLFIPILTFVFGEARLGGRGAVVSLRRLRQEFYGMPADPEILAARLLKESLHELGHTLGLRHCSAYRCAMSSSHAVESIDLKDAEFCARCRPALDL